MTGKAVVSSSSGPVSRGQVVTRGQGPHGPQSRGGPAQSRGGHSPIVSRGGHGPIQSRGGHGPIQQSRGGHGLTQSSRGQAPRGRGGQKLNGAQLRQQFVKGSNNGAPELPADLEFYSTDNESLVQQPEYNKMKMRY